MLIEHFAGAFPLWLAPEQVRVMVVSQKVEEYGRSVERQLSEAGLRVTRRLPGGKDRGQNPRRPVGTDPVHVRHRRPGGRRGQGGRPRPPGGRPGGHAPGRRRGQAPGRNPGENGAESGERRSESEMAKGYRGSNDRRYGQAISASAIGRFEHPFVIRSILPHPSPQLDTSPQLREYCDWF